MSSYCCSIPPQFRSGYTIGMERSGGEGWRVTCFRAAHSSRLLALTHGNQGQTLGPPFPKKAAPALAPRHALPANRNLLPSAGHHWHCRCHSCYWLPTRTAPPSLPPSEALMGSLEVGGALCPAVVTVMNSCLSLQSYLFLLSSDYERSEWREAIQKLQKKGKVPPSPTLF